MQISKTLVKFCLWKCFFLSTSDWTTGQIRGKILVQTTQDVRLMKMATKGALAYSVNQQYSSFPFLISL